MGTEIASKPQRNEGKRKLIIGKVVKILIGLSAIGIWLVNPMPVLPQITLKSDTLFYFKRFLRKSIAFF